MSLKSAKSKCLSVRDPYKAVSSPISSTTTLPSRASHLNYLAEGGALGHYDVKIALVFSRVLEKSLNRPRAADSHDDLFGVDVLQRLHRNVVGGPLWRNKGSKQNCHIWENKSDQKLQLQYFFLLTIFCKSVAILRSSATIYNHTHIRCLKVKHSFSQ